MQVAGFLSDGPAMSAPPRPLHCIESLPNYPFGHGVADVARQYQLPVEQIVQLASNENPLGPAPRVRQLLLGDMDIGRYPDGAATVLRQQLAERLNAAAEQIVIGNGSNELLELVARIYVAPGDEVIYSQYGFAVYPLLARALAARGVEAPAREYGHDLPALAAAVSERTRLIFLANPNNPTGTWFSGDSLRRFLAGIPERVVVVLDEAYYEYARDTGEYPRAIRMLDEFPNLFISRTFSKVWGLAALRIGYGIAHPEMAEWINRVRQPFSINRCAQSAALCALEDEQHLERSLTVTRDGLALLGNSLAEMGLTALPSLGNFVLFRTPVPGRGIARALLAFGVIVRPLDGYALPDWLRVTAGTDQQNRTFLTALARVLGA